jgi:DNA-binding XRE family transcriptional regulator
MQTLSKTKEQNCIKPHERLRAAMIMAGYNQDRMRKAMGLSLSAFNLKINGKREFTLNECKIAAQILGMTLDQLFFSQDVPK